MTFSFDFNDAPTRPALSEVTPAEWEARVERLREALARRAPELVRMLLPAARFEGDDARIGSLDGEPGESLSIKLTGPNAGVWFEFNGKAGGQQKGSLIDLWMQLEGRTFAESVDDLEKWCGIQAFPTWNTRVKARAEARAKEHSQRPPEEGKWETVKTYRYMAEDGATPLAFVHRQEHTHQRDPETGKRKKKFLQQRADGSWASPEGLRPLYHLPEIKEAKTVVLVEGEKCADALWDLRDIPATSAMAGANAPPEKTDWRPLAGKRVIIWPDNDEGGLALPDKVRPHLEQLGCTVWVVPIPAGKPKKWDAADAIEEGEDTDALLSAARPDEAAQAQPERKLRILSEDDLDELPEPSWLVDKVLPDAALVMLYGAPGSRKSFAAVDLAMAVASGRDWHGHEVSAGYALYVAGEGGAGIAKRLRGWRLSRGIEKTRRIGILPAPVAMPTGQLDELLAEIAQLPERPRLIILDTVARCFGAGNENDQKDMNAFVAACDKLKAVTGATVVVVHHSGKDSERGARGSSVLPGAVDVSIQVVRKDDVVTLRNRAPYGKMKDAEEFEDIALMSSQIEVGLDSRGEPITTLVLSAFDGVVVEEPTTDEHWTDVARTMQQREAQLGTVQRNVLSQLRNSDKPLGNLSLSHLTGSHKGTVHTAIQSLIQKRLVHQLPEVEGHLKVYEAIPIRGVWPDPWPDDDEPV